MKQIVITGVSRGLGRAMAAGFIAAGHTVAGCGRSAGLIAALEREHGAPHDFSVVDVSRDDAVGGWARRVLERHGAPDLLINNAGVIHRTAPLWEVPAGEFSEVMEINVGGVARVIRHFAPAMMARGGGMIVNFSSGWGRSADAGVAPYCASKWAVEGLTRSLACELPAGLAAVALNPGIIDTEMLRRCFGSEAGGYPGPEAWAKVAVPFLLQLGPAHNGQSLTVPAVNHGPGSN